MAAIQGELRLKRNRGVGVDDSDEESDNENNERARRAMKRLRTTDRSDIKALGAFCCSLCTDRC
jgi:mediator of replication checkpoint protein 1